MAPTRACIAHTHREWFDFLSRHATGGRLDEVNFWKPPHWRFSPGEPVFFRLGAPDRRVVGCGFFATRQELTPVLAWETFGFRNGAGDREAFFDLLGRRTPEEQRQSLGCMVLRDVSFWPDHRWIPWGTERGYAPTGNQQGKFDSSPQNVEVLFAELKRYGADPPPDLVEDFEPLRVDERRVRIAKQVDREGQGTFRLRLLDAYGWRCAISGEHTEPVLDAAHIQDYLGPRSNHIRNGLILTKEFHALFDKGLLTVEPPPRNRPDVYRIRVSKLIHERWNNGKRYLAFNGCELKSLPQKPALRPSPLALEWHRDEKFERVI